MLSAFFVIIIGSAIVAFAVRGLDRWEARVVALSYSAHVVSSIAQYWMQSSFYGGSDVLVYLDYGRMLSTLLDKDFFRWAPEIGRLIVHVPTAIPFEVFGETLTTGTMSGLAAVAVYILGDSPIAVFAAVATWSALGTIAMFRAARSLTDVLSERRIIAVSTLLVPSVVFWSSTLAKEAITIGFLGWSCWGVHKLVQRRLVLGSLTAGIGALGVALLKPYALFPFVMALGAALAMSRTRHRMVRPVYFLGGVTVALIGVLVMSRIFPDYAFDKLAEAAANSQLHGAEAGGGSYVEVGNPASESFGQQAQYLPLALINAFFRPTIFDVRNITLAAATVETTALAALVLALAIRAKGAIMWLALRQSPLLTFSVVMTFVFAVGVGMATTNLGTLSRYRVPMMPFYVFAVLDLHRRLRLTQPRALVQSVDGGAPNRLRRP